MTDSNHYPGVQFLGLTTCLHVFSVDSERAMLPERLGYVTDSTRNHLAFVYTEGLAPLEAVRHYKVDLNI